MIRRYRVTSGSSTTEADVRADGTLVISGTVYTVSPLDDGRLEVADGVGRVAVTVADDGRAVWVGARGATARLTVTASSSGPGSAGTAAAADMTAPMPATVVSIAAPPGSVVAKGDAVVVVEAMKMTVTVRAPRQGVVAAVHCRVGDLVKAGEVLAELDA